MEGNPMGGKRVLRPRDTARSTSPMVSHAQEPPEREYRLEVLPKAFGEASLGAARAGREALVVLHQYTDQPVRQVEAMSRHSRRMPFSGR